MSMRKRSTLTLFRYEFDRPLEAFFRPVRLFKIPKFFNLYGISSSEYSGKRLSASLPNRFSFMPLYHSPSTVAKLIAN